MIICKCEGQHEKCLKLSEAHARIAQLTAALEKIATPSSLEITRNTTQEDQTDFWHRASYTKLNIATDALTDYSAALAEVERETTERFARVVERKAMTYTSCNHTSRRALCDRCFATALADVERETIERCAKVADSYFSSDYNDRIKMQAETTAQAIRALKRRWE